MTEPLRRGSRFERCFSFVAGAMLAVAAIIVTAMVLAIVADVAARALFHWPLRGVTELVSVGIPMFVFLALPQLFARDRLIRSNLLLDRAGRTRPRVAATIESVCLLAGAAIGAAIAIPVLGDFLDAVWRSEFIGVEGDFTVPVWPAKLCIVIGAGMLAIGALRAFLWCAPWPRGAGIVAMLAITGALLWLLASGDPVRAGVVSVACLFVLIYAGMPVAYALGLCAMLGIAALKHTPLVAVHTLALVADSAVSDYVFAAVPLFVLMGLIVGAADIGRDSLYAVHGLLRWLTGGLGVATVAANAVFAAITGISVASAAIFSRVAVPPLIQHGYTPRFAVGLVAGSSVLGMLIPPSLLLIVYGLVAEVSINRLFIAAIVPGLLLTAAFALGVVAAVAARARFAVAATAPEHDTSIPPVTVLGGFVPILVLIGVVLGGIYGGLFTPTEAGAAGSLAAALLALGMRRLALPDLWRIARDAATNSASILLLIVAASAFAIMLTLSGIPERLSDSITAAEFGLTAYVFVYLALLIVLGMVLDSTSILLIMVPLALPTVIQLDGDLVWFGIITVIGVEIGLLTPPLGLSVFAIKASLDDPAISLHDIFVGALPFTFIMLCVTTLLIIFPSLSRFA